MAVENIRKNAWFVDVVKKGAYRGYIFGKENNIKKIPPWKKLPRKNKEAWADATSAMLEFFLYYKREYCIDKPVKVETSNPLVWNVGLIGFESYTMSLSTKKIVGWDRVSAWEKELRWKQIGWMTAGGVVIGQAEGSELLCGGGER